MDCKPLMSAFCLPQHIVPLTPCALYEPQRIQFDQISSRSSSQGSTTPSSKEQHYTSTKEANSSAKRDQLQQHHENQPYQHGELLISGTKFLKPTSAFLLNCTAHTLQLPQSCTRAQHAQYVSSFLLLPLVHYKMSPPISLPAPTSMSIFTAPNLQITELSLFTKVPILSTPLTAITSKIFSFPNVFSNTYAS